MGPEQVRPGSPIDWLKQARTAIWQISTDGV